MASFIWRRVSPSRETSLKWKGGTLAIISLGSLGVASFIGYRFLKRYQVFALLTGVPRKRFSELEVPEYARLEGHVTTVHPKAAPTAPTAAVTTSTAPSASDPLISPKASNQAGVPCVSYVVIEYRVVEERSTTTTHVKKGKAKASITGDLGTTDGGVAYTKDNWSQKLEVVKEYSRSKTAYLKEDEASKNGVVVQVDFTEALYLEYETVYDEFTPAERQVEVNSSRRTLGFRTVEKVLPIDASLLIFGYVEAKGGESRELVVKKPPSRHLFDKRTARLYPFVVTTMTENQLLAQLERLLRRDVAIAGGAALLATISGFLGGRSLVILKDLLQDLPPQNM